MLTLSARHWTATRSFGRALVFWVWLASFVSAFAASDCFHAATCPEQLTLKWALHCGPTLSPSSHSHAGALDVECVACALQDVALAFFVGCAGIVLFFCFSTVADRFIAPRLASRRSLPIARGPPVVA